MRFATLNYDDFDWDEGNTAKIEMQADAFL
jgi:hypothetical protein